uniref:ATP synthase F0 subunit 8 n=1 Tax=Tetramorium tsushimae TaxID=291737 RepID=A0A8F9RYX4_9HYME|nr:ATP synthase F0 subunit 8 [Tetramorium tsushimae]
MPQMMPLLWFFMMFYFILCLLMISCFMYFFTCPKIKLTFKKSNFNKNWIWMW